MDKTPEVTAHVNTFRLYLSEVYSPECFGLSDDSRMKRVIHDGKIRHPAPIIDVPVVPKSKLHTQVPSNACHDLAGLRVV